MPEQFTIGSYVFVRYLGKGGMAAVWEARHSHLDLGRLAIKFLLEEYATNRELQERFFSEARIQSKLHHPSIVKVRDFFQSDGRSYMVMEYVEPPAREGYGDDAEAMPLNLEARLEQSAGLSLDQVHTFSTDILSALQYSHEHDLSVVHRDIKPSNIMLSRSGHAVLTDFGIAKVLNESGSGALTRSTIGTPDYMSPEQITSESPVDQRSDIYGFGCVLYAILSGNPPFAGNASTDFNIKYCHVHHAPPPLAARNGLISESLRDVVMRCLEKDPARRFQTCADVSAALTLAIYPPAPPVVEVTPPMRAEVPRPVSPRTEAPASPHNIKKIDPVKIAPPPTNRKMLTRIIAVVMILALAVGGYFVWRGSTATRQSDQTFTPISTPPVAKPALESVHDTHSLMSGAPVSGPSVPKPSLSSKQKSQRVEKEDSDCCVNTPECRLARKQADLKPCGFINNN